MKILIDADGCPVTDLAIKIASEFNIESVLFCDTSHEFKNKNVRVVTVSKGADSADFALVNEVNTNDVIVTQDYGLAAMAISKGGKPITQNGLIINDFNIDGLLTTRYESKKARMSGKHLKGPKKRTKEQDVDFEKSLRRLIGENENCNNS